MKSKPSNSRSGFFINIVLPSAFAVVLFIATLFFIVIPAFEDAMMDRKREMIKELTNAATSILAKYHKDETDSFLSRNEAQQTAISRIQYLRYGSENKDYFWITDMKPVMIMHPYRPELNGQNLSEFKDSHGKKLFVESVKIAKENGQGYVDYMWQWMDDSTHIVPKLSYVKAFKPWDWIIGTGIYIEDVKKEIAILTQKFVRISIIISLITALILFYVGRQSLKIERKRRKAEEALNESKEKYKSLVEASTEGLLMLMDGEIIFSNSVLQKMTGMTSDEIMLKSLSDFISVPSEISSQLNENKIIHFNPIETQLNTINNKTLSVLLSISSVIFNDKDAVIFSLKDVSSDKQIKEELFQNKEKFKVLMDKLDIGIFRTTIDLKGRFLEANETALQILGYKNIDELTNTYILDIFVDVDDKKSFRRNLLENGFLKNQVLKLKRKNGQFTVVSVSLVVVEDEKNPKFCDGIIEDITSQKKSNTFSDNLINEYTSFSQLFYQSVKKFLTPSILIKYNEKVETLVSKMTLSKTDSAFVIADSGEVLGIITDKDLRERAFSKVEDFEKKVFEIMTSPVISINQNNMLFEALLMFKNHEVNHLMIKDSSGQCLGTINKQSLSGILSSFPSMINLIIDNSHSIPSLLEFKNKYIQSLLPVIENNIHPNIVFNSLSVMSDSLTSKIIELVIKEIGEPPVEFCFLSLGSDARNEQTFSTDQDNALIFKDVPKESLESTYKYFNIFSKKVCTYLNDVGYDFCKGNVMAMNNEWCQPLSVWKSYFNKWINKGNAKDLLDINIFFDIRAVYGNKEYEEILKNHIFELTLSNPAYLYHLTQNTLMLKPQVGFWGNILLETAGAPPETVNIKETIMPIVNFARIYALKNQLITASTSQRLLILSENNVLRDATYTNIIQALDQLNMMRLKHQAFLLRSNLKPDNLINTKNLSELDKTIIKKVISNINSMLTKLSFDFKGSL